MIFPLAVSLQQPIPFPELSLSAYAAKSEAETVRSVLPDLRRSPILIWRDQTGAAYKTSYMGVPVNINSADITINGKAIKEAPVSFGKMDIVLSISTIVKGEDVSLLAKEKRDLFVTLGFPKSPFSAERRPWVKLLEWSVSAAIGSFTEEDAMRHLVEKISGTGDRKTASLYWEDEGRFASPPGFDVWSPPYTDVPALIAALSSSTHEPTRSNCYTFAGLLQASAASLGIAAKVRVFSVRPSRPGQTRSMLIQPEIGVTTDSEAPNQFNVHAVVLHGKESLVSDANLYIRNNRQPLTSVSWPKYLKDTFGLEVEDVEWQDYVPRPVLPGFK